MFSVLLNPALENYSLLKASTAVMEDDPVPRAATRRRSGGFRLERPSEEGDDAFTLTLKVSPAYTTWFRTSRQSAP
jgi:hypothetical protein